MTKVLRYYETADQNGRIHLDPEVGDAGEEVEIVLTVKSRKKTRKRSWPEFVDYMAGSCPDLEVPEDYPPEPLDTPL